MIHSTRKAMGEDIWTFDQIDIHIMRLNETEEGFDARIEGTLKSKSKKQGLINAIEEER